MTRRIPTAAIASAVFLGAAGVGGAAMLAWQDDEPAAPISATPTPEPPTTQSPPTLASIPEPVDDVVLAWTSGGVDPQLEAAAKALPMVTATSLVRGEVVDLVGSADAEGKPVDSPGAGWAIPLDGIAIDPTAHAEFAPLSDQPTIAGLADGEALLSRTSAGLRRLSEGGRLDLADDVSLVVSGIVDDTAIGGAEIAMTRATGEGIGIRTARYLLVAHGGDRPAVEDALRATLPPARPVRFRGPGETPFLRNGDAVLPPLVLKERFGEFAYRHPPAGQRDFIQDPAWRARNLVAREVPILRTVRCHRGIIDALEGALRELESEGLADLIDPAGYAGCWNSRLVGPGGSVSHHAWGVGFDINYGTNPTGLASVQDPRLVEILARWGFTWGGEWLVPDPAHFEYIGPPRQ